MNNLNEEDKRVIEGAANQMGVTVEQLMAAYTNPKDLAESIKNGTYKVLKEN